MQQSLKAFDERQIDCIIFHNIVSVYINDILLISVSDRILYITYIFNH